MRHRHGADKALDPTGQAQARQLPSIGRRRALSSTTSPTASRPARPFPREHEQDPATRAAQNPNKRPVYRRTAPSPISAFVERRPPDPHVVLFTPITARLPQHGQLGHTGACSNRRSTSRVGSTLRRATLHRERAALARPKGAQRARRRRADILDLLRPPRQPELSISLQMVGIASRATDDGAVPAHEIATSSGCAFRNWAS